MFQWGVGVWMSVAMGCWGVDECQNGVLRCGRVLQWGAGVRMSVAMGC